MFDEMMWREVWGVLLGFLLIVGMAISSRFVLTALYLCLPVRWRRFFDNF